MAETTAASALRRRSPHPSPSCSRGPGEPLEPAPAADVKARTAGSSEQVDARAPTNVCLAPVVRASRMTEARLSSLYESDGFGGEKTMRARVIREPIDENRVLRRELAQAEGREPVSPPEV